MYINLDKQPLSGNQRYTLYIFRNGIGYALWISMFDCGFRFLESVLILNSVPLPNIHQFSIHTFSISFALSNFTLAAMETEFAISFWTETSKPYRVIISSCNAAVRLWLNAIVASERSSQICCHHFSSR